MGLYLQLYLMTFLLANLFKQFALEEQILKYILRHFSSLFYQLVIQLIMQQQRLCQAQDLGMDEEVVLKSIQYDLHKLQKEQTKDQLNKQPIFRVDMNLLDLQYNLTDPAYLTNSQLLNHTKIRSQDREKLKTWLLMETHNLYQRQTYAHASRFLDMFFSKLHKVPKISFQALGIACLILAAKVVERRMPSVSFQVFDKNQIFNFERGLFQIFNYKVFPVTYVCLSELLFYFWDNYQNQINPFKEVKYFKEDVKSIRMTRIIMETLDCMDLVPLTLDIPLENLVCAVFIVENRRFCLEAFKNDKQNQAINLVQTDHHSLFNTVYEKFLIGFFKSLGALVPAFSNVQIDHKIILYTLCFSRMNPKINISTKIKNYRFELARQTYNSQITELAQNIMNKKMR